MNVQVNSELFTTRLLALRNISDRKEFVFLSGALPPFLSVLDEPNPNLQGTKVTC